MIFIFFTRQIPFHPAEETHIYRNEYFCPWLGHLGNSKKNGSFDGKWQVRKRQIVIQIFQQSWLLHNLMSMSWTKCKMKCLKLQSYISPSPFTKSVTRMAIIKNNLLVYLPFWSNVTHDPTGFSLKRDMGTAFDIACIYSLPIDIIPQRIDESFSVCHILY